MAPEQTNAKRHGPNRATTVICLVLILAAALVIARMVKFRSQVDVTLPAVLWEGGEAAAVNTTLHFHGELVKQWGQDDSFSGYLELEDQPFTSEEANRVMLTIQTLAISYTNYILYEWHIPCSQNDSYDLHNFNSYYS